MTKPKTIMPCRKRLPNGEKCGSTKWAFTGAGNERNERRATTIRCERGHERTTTAKAVLEQSDAWEREQRDGLAGARPEDVKR